MKNHKEEIREKVIGSLFGTAYGDALGMPVEMWTREKIKTFFPEPIDHFMPSIDGENVLDRAFEKGKVTDDTENTLFVLEMIAANHGKISTEAYVKSLLDWKNTDPAIDQKMGPSTRRAIEAIEKGKPLHPEDGSEGPGYHGTTNGAVMKISPAGMISDWHDLRKLADNVEQLCLPTHYTNIAIAGACAICACISYALSGNNDLDEMIEIAKQAAAEGNRRGNQVFEKSLCEQIDKAVFAAKNMKHEDALEYFDQVIGTGLETFETVPTVLGLVVMARGNLYEACSMAVNLGGDTDTIASIAGAICGTLFPRWKKEDQDLLETVNDICFEEKAELILPYVQMKME